MAKDLVCGMEVNEQDARANNLTSEYQGTTYCFCSSGCKARFDRDPGHYATSGHESHEQHNH